MFGSIECRTDVRGIADVRHRSCRLFHLAAPIGSRFVTDERSRPDFHNPGPLPSRDQFVECCATDLVRLAKFLD
jgi:hypothetical protein